MIIVLYLHFLISLNILLILCAEYEPLLRPIYLLYTSLKSERFWWTRMVSNRFIQRLAWLSVLVETCCRVTSVAQTVNLRVKVRELWVPLWKQTINDVDLTTYLLLFIQVTVAAAQIKFVLMATSHLVVIGVLGGVFEFNLDHLPRFCYLLRFLFYDRLLLGF